MDTPLFILALGAALALSFFMSGMESGVFALSRLRIRRLVRAGKPSAKVLHGYLENSEDFLWTILVGNTLANFTAVCLVVMKLQEWLDQHPVWFWVALVAGGLVFYGAFELLPKMLFRLYPNRLCLLFSRPFGTVHALLRPLVWLMARVSALVLRLTGGKIFTGYLFGSRDELRRVMQESAAGLTLDERGLINRVLDLQNRTVKQIITPLAKVVTVTTQTPVTEVLELCRGRSLSRLPVWEGEGAQRRIAGLVNLRSLLYVGDLEPGKTAGDHLKPAAYLDEDMRLETAMRHLQRGGQRLAIVLGRDRKEIGVVSLQDILQAIFGEVSL